MHGLFLNNIVHIFGCDMVQIKKRGTIVRKKRVLYTSNTLQYMRYCGTRRAWGRLLLAWNKVYGVIYSSYDSFFMASALQDETDKEKQI